MCELDAKPYVLTNKPKYEETLISSKTENLLLLEFSVNLRR